MPFPQQPGSMLFVNAQRDTPSYRFTDPVSCFTAYTVDDLSDLFRRLDEAAGQKLYAAGYIAYEAGYALEPALRPLLNHDGEPLAHFAFYAKRETFRYQPEPSPTQTPHPTFSVSRSAYEQKIVCIRQHIERGDTYQVNLTAPMRWADSSTPEALLHHILAVQPVAYGALLETGDTAIVSASPELFFRREGGKIYTRPMKGTAPRGMTVEGDARQADWLANDEKNRAENLMIVDLLRNDLGRICRPGSVRVDRLFDVERYATLLQMTSTISGELTDMLSWDTIFRALFPSGSIVGAPKIKTMQIIHEIEDEPRGVYTGCIGFITPEGEATFSVAIRTIVLENGRARMGTGGGITWDSDPATEYDECLLKASFLQKDASPFQLIETMGWDGNRVHLLEEHLARLQSSAAYFGFPCDASSIRSAIATHTELLATPHRLRLLLSADGEVTLQSFPFARDRQPLRVVLSDQRTSSSDRFLRHKTTRRALYNAELARVQPLGYGEVLFLNERGEITEGAISNFFLERDGKLITPPLACGVLPGVLRTHLNPEEQVLRLDDIRPTDNLYLGSALRGLRPIVALDREPGADSPGSL